MDSFAASNSAVIPPVSVDAVSKIVRGKALSYQSDHAISVSDGVTHRGQRYSVKDDQKLQSSFKISTDRKDDNVKRFKNLERNEISAHTLGLPNATPADGIVISKGKGALQREKLIVRRTSEERYD